MARNPFHLEEVGQPSHLEEVGETSHLEEVGQTSQWSDADFDLDDFMLPPEPQWQRCGAIHCIDRGPWIGTLVCCIRRSGHDDAHSMSLGDEGETDYWRESWL